MTTHFKLVHLCRYCGTIMIPHVKANLEINAMINGHRCPKCNEFVVLFVQLLDKEELCNNIEWVKDSEEAQ